jgi:hypothetical protein
LIFGIYYRDDLKRLKSNAPDLAQLTISIARVKVMKRISSYFAPAGEKRAKPTATDENQNEAITTNLENP